MATNGSVIERIVDIVAIFQYKGSLDSETEDLEERVDEHIENGIKDIIVDFTEVVALTPPVIKATVCLGQKLNKNASGALHIVHSAPSRKVYLRIPFDFDEIMTRHDTVTLALQFIRS